MCNLFWIDGQKVNKIPIVNNFICRYNIIRINGNSYWKCNFYNCKASCVISSLGELVKTSGEHMHENSLDMLLNLI
jgi:hypothetical protein